MILDFLTPTNEQTKLNLLRIDRFIQGTNFLKGLGLEADILDYKNDLLVTGSFIEGVTLFSSQEMMKHDRPWSHQYFPEQYAAAAELLRDVSLPIDNQELSAQRESRSKYLDQVERSFVSLEERHGIFEANKDIGVSSETLEWALRYTIEGYLYDLLDNIIYSAYFSKFHQSLFWNRICEFFEAGGLPCGWIGGKSIQEGGAPEKCLVMCHRNTKGRPKEIVFPGLKDII